MGLSLQGLGRLEEAEASFGQALEEVRAAKTDSEAGAS